MLWLHFIRGALTALAVAVPLVASAQQPPVPPPLPDAGATNFTIFLRGAPIGSEQIAVTRTAIGWTIVSSGRLGAPIDVVARRLQARYTPEWRPVEFSLDGTVRGQQQTIRTTFDGTTAKSLITVGGQPTEKSDPVDAAAVVLLPNSFFGPYEALAARLRTVPAGTEISAYLVGQMSISIRAGETTAEQIQTAARVVSARRTRITLALPNARLDADLWADDSGRMIRFSVPAQSLEVVREDIAAVSARSLTISRPNDEALSIPGNGFLLAGTLSRPAQSTDTRLPAVVLVGGSGPADRDGVAYGIPVLGQIADSLANAGWVVVRYDKRGIGQSGGRAESASLADYAEDVRAALKMLEKRKDVDPKRIAVVGHSEGGLVALIAAAKEKKIAAVGLLATPGLTGADVVLAQQQRLLNRMTTLTPEEKQAKVDAQKKIHEAVISGKGLELLPLDVRRSVDNAEFQSLLTSDPAKLVADVRQPLLIVQGQLDTQVEPANADRLETLARSRKNAPAPEVIKVPGVNHLLVPATTGEVDEYATLKDKQVSRQVTDAIVTWLKKTLSPSR